MALNFSVQSLQFRRKNKQGRMTLRYVWDVVSRTDSPARMLIESWGGKPDGYIKTFGTDLILGKYLSGRIAKASAGTADDTDIDLELVGDYDYKVSGPLNNLGKALEAKNHEQAKLRLQITGVDTKWDDDACLNKVTFGLLDFGDDSITCDRLNQAMASRVRGSFKSGGEYPTNVIAIDDFMTSAVDDLSDVLGGEETVYAPMDKERIAEVIQVADGLRDKLTVSYVSKEPTPKVIIPEPIIDRGVEWGGWA